MLTDQPIIDAYRLPPNGATIHYGTDENLVVEFYKRAEPNNFKSKEAGRPVFDEVDFVQIIIPGDSRTKVDRPAREEDRVRFPRAWEAYQRQAPVGMEGTPVDQWSRLSISQRAEAKASNIFTVEAIANLSDSVCQQMGMGWQDLRAEAQGFIAKAKGEAPAQAMAAALAEANAKLAEQDARIDELKGLVDKLTPPDVKAQAATRKAA